MADFSRIQEIVRGIRNARSEYGVEPARRIVALFSAGEYADLVRANLALLAGLARVDADKAEIAAHLPAPEKAATLAAGGVTVYLPLAGMVDLAAERKRIEKELKNIDGQLKRIDGMLSNPGFVEKAPDAVVDRERIKKVELSDRRVQLAERLADLA